MQKSTYAWQKQNLTENWLWEPLVEELKKNLFALGTARLAALAAAGLAITLIVFFGLGSIFSPTYRALYGDLDPAAASRIVSTLEQAGFRVSLDGTGRVVSVPEPDVARARMALADQGLPAQGAPGWEIFDDASGLGMNSFMQRVSRLRALEGELARSIATIEGVESGRVHLVLPEREAFSNTRPEPSASVIIQSRAGYSLSRRQALAIRALVASAVPEMAPGRVTVLSSSGETILSDDGDSPGDVSIAGMQATLEERLSNRVSQLLAARLGTENVRVETSVKLTTDRQVIREQSFDPDQQVVRSTENTNEQREGTEAAADQVTVANEIPPELGGGNDAGARSSNRSSQSNEIINYEIGTTTSETVREPGDIERISVAVLVNGIYEPGTDGTAVYRDRTEAELEQIERLVQSAIGFDSTRGDLISVESMEFVAFDQNGSLISQSGFGEFWARYGNTVLRGAFGLAVVLAVLLLAVRPALKRALPGKEEQAAALAAPEAASGALPSQDPALRIGRDQERQEVMNDGRVQRIDPSLDTLLYDDEAGDLISLASVRGGVRKRRVQSVGDLVDAEPEEAMRVLKSWLAEA